MLSCTLLKCLDFLDKKHGLYIFEDNKLLKARPYNVVGDHNYNVSGVEFNHPTDGPSSIYINRIREEYFLYGNVLFEKEMCITDRQVFNSLITADPSNTIDLYDYEYADMEERFKKILQKSYIYHEKDNNTKANKTSKNNNDVINKAVKAMKNNKEQNTMKNNFSDIINMKMMMGIINNKGEIDLTKLMVLQSFTKDGNIEITDIIKTKLTERILKDTNSKEDLPLEKLALINMLDNGNLDLQEIIKYKMLSSDDMDMEKMMMMSCMTNGGDITDIIKYKMMMQMFKETETEQK